MELKLRCLLEMLVELSKTGGEKEKGD